MCTPLNPYWNAVRPPWTGGGCRRADNPDHLADLHEWTLTSEVSELSTPPALLPCRLRNPLWVESHACSGWTLEREERRRRISAGERGEPIIKVGSVGARGGSSGSVVRGTGVGPPGETGWPSCARPRERTARWSSARLMATSRSAGRWQSIQSKVAAGSPSTNCSRTILFSSLPSPMEPPGCSHLVAASFNCCANTNGRSAAPSLFPLNPVGRGLPALSPHTVLGRGQAG